MGRQRRPFNTSPTTGIPLWHKRFAKAGGGNSRVWSEPPTKSPTLRITRTFERSKLNWEETERGEHGEMLAWYRNLIKLRRQSRRPPRLDQVTVDFDEAAGWLHVESGSLTVVCNFAASATRVPLSNRERERKVALASKEQIRLTHEAAEMPPVSIAIMD